MIAIEYVLKTNANGWYLFITGNNVISSGHCMQIVQGGDLRFKSANQLVSVVNANKKQINLSIHSHLMPLADVNGPHTPVETRTDVPFTSEIKAIFQLVEGKVE